MGRSFTDVPPTSPFYRFVETMRPPQHHDRLQARQLLPGREPISREQMAVFVLLAKEGTGYRSACLHDALLP